MQADLQLLTGRPKRSFQLQPFRSFHLSMQAAKRGQALRPRANPLSPGHRTRYTTE